MPRVRVKSRPRWQHACVRQPVPVPSKVGAQHNTHGGPQHIGIGTRDARTESVGRAVAYFASSTYPGRGVDVFVTSTLLPRGREKYAAPKTFCAITTIFLLWLISRRRKFGRARAFPVAIGPRCVYRLKLFANAMSDGATDAIPSRWILAVACLRTNFGESHYFMIILYQYLVQSCTLIDLS